MLLRILTEALDMLLGEGGQDAGFGYGGAVAFEPGSVKGSKSITGFGTGLGNLSIVRGFVDGVSKGIWGGYDLWKLLWP